MNKNSPAAHRDQKEKQISFLEVINLEKLLWATIQHKGISHAEVQDLYRKARSSYENIILNNYQSVDLQEVEYSLWKLHYKHIDEYRKKIKKVSAGSESTNSLNSHLEGFKLFLSDVAEFYKDLIAKFKKTCGLSEDILLFKKSMRLFSDEPEMLRKCRYVCHRFLVCLGDLSRYRELCKKPDVQKWGTAATYYLEATTVWPHSGNPQNQLALLATYIGDDFLALYHCMRSLAVKEPFPDARDNIMLLFEKNKSSQLQSLSTDAHIDFSKPLKRLSSQLKSHSSIDSTNINKLRANEHVPPVKIDLWPLFVRMISFFLVKPSFDDLPHTFASTMKELESLLALNDTDLSSSLEPYEHFDSSKKGPYRALQAITILIFVIQNLLKTPSRNSLNCEPNEQLSACIIWAWTCTFSFLGHVIQRCTDCSSLLPAVNVFLEWYVGVIDRSEVYGEDEKVCNAESYFLSALVELLNRLEVKEPDLVNSALWEDYELIGFEPVAQSNGSLDFTSSENRAKFEAGNSLRVHRVHLASIKIIEKLTGFLKIKDPEKFLTKNEALEEEDEVILFKPLIRVNSEPVNQTELVDRTEPKPEPEDTLRRSTSGQNGSHETSSKRSPYSTGPPSLSAWVVNQESPKNPEPKKPELAPIAELSTSYVTPVPSAPLLPEDPVWLRGGLVSDQNGLLGAPPVGRFTNPQEPLGVHGFVDAYRPPVFGLTSSEWLYRYKNNLSLEGGNGNNIIPNSNNHRPVFYDVIDRWGNPVGMNRMVYFENPDFGYGGDENQREKNRVLKEREWRL